MVSETLTREELDLSVIDAIVYKHNVQPGGVIPVLQEIQESYGYVPPVAIQRVAEHLNIPASEIFGIVTFYAQFRLEPLGKNLIKVCHGTACHLAQATGAREGETSADDMFTVERVACLGCCSLAPCIMVNSETHGRLTPETTTRIVSEIKKAEVPA